MASWGNSRYASGGKGSEISELNQLQTLLRAIVPYLPQPVVEAQMATPQVGVVRGEYWQGSVLFADLSGFTALSETLSRLGKQGAEEITRIVNDLFEALLEDVERHGGILVKFGGDALTVFFGGEGHSARAAGAGLALQETMARRFVNLETPGGVFTLRLRVGVHTGKVFAAQVGYVPEFSLRGMELVVTGADINRVAEAQDCAAPGDVCITAETVAQLLSQVAIEPLSEGLHRLCGLDVPDLSPPASLAPDWIALEAWPLEKLRRCVEALEPYLPWDLADERITDPSDPELRSDLRPVAVLFANFANMSGILAALTENGTGNVEPATRILNMYYARMQDVIGRYGGVVNKVDMYTHGDKLMAIFGAPMAHEDDAERAVRAAQEMQAAMPEINRYVQRVLQDAQLPYTPLTQRIGINFGHVLAGNVGSGRAGRRREYTVMGDTVNLAARLMAAAEEGDILISPSVHRQISGKFRLDDLAPIRVKGKREPIPVSRPVRPLTEREKDALQDSQRIFIGRTAQLEAMHDAVQRAVAGLGQVLVVIGEAGTGKTRLVGEFQDQLAELFPVTCPNCYATELPSFAQEPYAPIVDLLRRILGLGGETGDDMVLLRDWVQERVPEMERFMPLLGDLLALPIGDNIVTFALAPEQRRDRLFDVIEAVLRSEAQQHPLVLVVDDLQWVDDASLALLERLTSSVATTPVLLILCYRPDVSFSTPWVEHPQTLVVHVGEFAADESAQLVAELLEAEELPTDLLELVWAKAQGNPFFTEEFVKSLQETAAIVLRDGRWQMAAGGMAITAIPDTIEGIVLARLDRLGIRFRDVLQEAAVAAASQPRFVQSLLERVDPQPIELPGRLNRLVNEGLLEALESELEVLEYHFRHAVTRDVAYDSMLYARRRELHHLIGQAIEALYADRLDEHVASLAHHYLEAERWAEAFQFQRRAGERAQVLFANKNAIAFFRRALSIAEARLPDMLAVFDAESFVTALTEIRERLGDVLVLEGRYDEALETFEMAHSLLTQDSPPQVTAKFLRKTAEVHERKGDYPQALEWLERGLQELGDLEVAEMARIYNLGGGVYYRQGEREEALKWLERGLHIAEQGNAQSEIANAYLTMATTFSELGETDRGLDYGRRSLAAYQAAEDLAGSVKAHINLGIASRRADNWTEAVEHYREGLRLSEMMGDVMRIGQFANNMGEVYLDQGNLDQAAAAYQRSFDVFEPIGFLLGVAVVDLNLGKVAVLRGDLDTGERCLADAAALAQEIGAGVFMPEIYHWQALLELARRRYDAALDRATQALELARELKDRVEEGCALRVLGQVYAAMGQSQKAIESQAASLDVLVELKSPYQVSKTLFQMALVYLDDPEKRREGLELLEQARTFFSELGAQWDLAEVEKLAPRRSR